MCANWGSAARWFNPDGCFGWEPSLLPPGPSLREGAAARGIIPIPGATGASLSLAKLRPILAETVVNNLGHTLRHDFRFRQRHKEPNYHGRLAYPLSPLGYQRADHPDRERRKLHRAGRAQPHPTTSHHRRELQRPFHTCGLGPHSRQGNLEAADLTNVAGLPKATQAPYQR